jgi:methyltransferase-like protein/2-polyprenyl-3-methyl-5-hydroxy-6-metoxy-1,4-benzoquinol methylase
METSYDLIPYQSHAYPQTHPDRLATIARIFGLVPAPVTRCRVLELGCAGGGNLIPMAFHLPESEFIGVDLSLRQVKEAQKTISDLGLKNIRIENVSIMDIDHSCGIFDYIISHGVFSWVSHEVQDKILAVSSCNLAPQGIAYISYNTYPGWHMREMIRHMMHYHIGQFEETAKRIEQARAVVDFMADSVSTDSYYGSMLKSELDLVRSSKDWYLFHDHLEEVNTPVYFHQFIDHAAKHGLQYLAEADFSTMLGSGFPQKVADTLARISPTIIRTEQYMDFLRNRFFRQTLLCNKKPALDRNLNGDSIDGLLLASSAKPETVPIDIEQGKKQYFRTSAGMTFNSDFSPTKAALTVLYEHWPRAIDQNHLMRKSFEFLGRDIASEKTREEWKRVQGDLLHCYSLNIVEFHTWQAEIVKNVSDRPKASRLAAYQSRAGISIVNQRHEHVSLDAVGNELIRVLDGNKDRSLLQEHLYKCVEKGALSIRQDDIPVTDKHLIKHTLGQVLDQTLEKMATAALLTE